MNLNVGNLSQVFNLHHFWELETICSKISSFLGLLNWWFPCSTIPSPLCLPLTPLELLVFPECNFRKTLIAVAFHTLLAIARISWSIVIISRIFVKCFNHPAKGTFSIFSFENNFFFKRYANSSSFNGIKSSLEFLARLHPAILLLPGRNHLPQCCSFRNGSLLFRKNIFCLPFWADSREGPLRKGRSIRYLRLLDLFYKKTFLDCFLVLALSTRCWRYSFPNKSLSWIWRIVTLSFSIDFAGGVFIKRDKTFKCRWYDIALLVCPTSSTVYSIR